MGFPTGVGSLGTIFNPTNLWDTIRTFYKKKKKKSHPFFIKRIVNQSRYRIIFLMLKFQRIHKDFIIQQFYFKSYLFLI